MADEKKAVVSVVHKPAVMFGGQEQLEACYDDPDYPGLREWSERMAQLDRVSAAPPEHWVVVPSRAPDAVCTLGSPPVPHGRIDVRQGDTLAGLFGPLWQYVYELDANEELRSLHGDDPNRIDVGDAVYFPVGWSCGDESIWPDSDEAQCYEFPLPEVPPESGDMARDPATATEPDEPSNNLSAAAGAVYKVKLHSFDVELKNCVGDTLAAVESEVEATITASPSLAGLVRVLTKQDMEEVEDGAPTVNVSNDDLTLDVNGSTFTLDRTGNFSLSPESGGPANVSYSSEDGFSGEISGPAVEFKGKWGKLELEQSTGISADSIDLNLGGTYSLTITGDEGEVTVDVAFSVSLKIKPAGLLEQMECAPEAVPVEAPFRIPDSVARWTESATWVTVGTGVVVALGKWITDAATKLKNTGPTLPNGYMPTIFMLFIIPPDDCYLYGNDPHMCATPDTA